MRKYNIADELDSDFFFLLAHLTHLNKEELMVSSINFDDVLGFDE